MGLGKTIEVMALVLSHRYEPGGAETKEEEDEEDDAPPAPALAAAASTSTSASTGISGDGGPGKGEDAAACPCGLPHQQGRRGAQHQRWIRCDACKHWVHIECAGLADQAAADALAHYTCEVCHGLRRFRRPRPGRATLIVTPELICEQWEEELAQRVQAGDSLRVAIYRGVAETRPEQRAALLNPDRLGNDYDVVLTTFGVLGKDLAHTDTAFLPKAGEAGRSLRQRKKYRVTPSPLAAVRWWRVCLDEAQMVESSTAAAAKMALRLHTVHRWCVSGTPIWKGQLDDLYGLLVFLQVCQQKPRNGTGWLAWSVCLFVTLALIGIQSINTSPPTTGRPIRPPALVAARHRAAARDGRPRGRLPPPRAALQPHVAHLQEERQGNVTNPPQSSLGTRSICEPVPHTHTHTHTHTTPPHLNQKQNRTSSPSPRRPRSCAASASPASSGTSTSSSTRSARGRCRRPSAASAWRGPAAGRRRGRRAAGPWVRRRSRNVRPRCSGSGRPAATRR